ncbi:hypothetical protein HYQ46_013204 [Verticillium longisporum]|nr:hypothetical protein HYQ46_013204 [Verticillium longisporum]
MAFVEMILSQLSPEWKLYSYSDFRFGQSLLGSKETWYTWQDNRAMYNEFKLMVELQPRSHDHTERPRTINSLAIRAYMKEYDSKPAHSDDFDPELLETTIQQIKIFFFAGHDTTSSALCLAYSRYYKSPNNSADCALNTMLPQPQSFDGSLQNRSNARIPQPASRYNSLHQREATPRRFCPRSNRATPTSPSSTRKQERSIQPTG